MVMPPTKGFLSQAKEVLGRGVTQSAAFQKLTGAADESEALENVYFEILPRDENDEASIESMPLAELENKRPFCVVFLDMPAGISIDNSGSGVALTANVNAAYYFEVDIAEMVADVMDYFDGSGDKAETIEEFAQYMDNILGEISVEVATNLGDSLNRIDQFDRRFSAERDKFSTGSWSSGQFFVSLGVE